MKYHKYILRKYNDNVLIKNTTFLNLTQLINGIFGIIFWMLVSLIYPLNEIGKAALLISTMNSITYYSRLGIETSINRFNYLIKQNSSVFINTVINTIMGISILFSTFGFIIFNLYYKLFQINLSYLKFCLFFVIFTVLWTEELLFDSIYTSLLESKFVLFRNLLFHVLKIILVVILSKIILSLGIFWGWGFALILVYPISIFFLKKIVPEYNFGFYLKFHFIKEISRLSLGIFLANVIIKTYSTFLPFIIAKNIGIDYVGVFYIAWVLTTITYSLVTNFSLVMLAKISSKHLVHSELKKGFILMLIFSLFLTLLSVVGGKIFLPLLFPKMSNQLADIFLIYSFAIPFYGIIMYYQMIKYYEKNPLISILMNFMMITIAFVMIFFFHSTLIELSISWVLSLFIGCIWALVGIVHEIYFLK